MEEPDMVPAGESPRPPLTLTVDPNYLDVGRGGGGGGGEAGVLSPQTPSSMFTNSVVARSKGCVVMAILLCYWDNILGPRIRHLWQTEVDESKSMGRVTSEMLHYVATHTLNGEICRDPNDVHVDSKFYVLRDRSVAVTAFIFGALGKGDFGVHSLSVIVNHKDLPVYLNWQPLTLSWMARGVPTLRIMLEKTQDSEALGRFSSYLSDYVSMLKSLRELGLPHNIPLVDTAFHPEHGFDPRIVHDAILSHLMTCGSTVVYGRSPARINLMISTLAMFLRPQERACCRYVSQNSLYTYHHDIFIQGLLLNAEEDISQALKDIYHSRYPTTLVDLETQQVKLSSLPHEHSPLRHWTRREELDKLWRGHGTDSYPTRDMFHTFEDPDTIVTDFLGEMTHLPLSGGHREAFINQFMQLLDKKALALIKHLEALTANGKNVVSDCSKRLRHDLSLSVPGDFYVVLTSAEKLKPGVYSVVCNDPKVKLDDPASYALFNK